MHQTQALPLDGKEKCFAYDLHHGKMSSTRKNEFLDASCLINRYTLPLVFMPLTASHPAFLAVSVHEHCFHIPESHCDHVVKMSMLASESVPRTWSAGARG